MTDIVELLRNEMKHSDELCYKAADEIEKLRAKNANLAASNHAYLSDYQEAVAEIEKLRAALKAADWVIEWTGEDLLNGNPYSKVLERYQEARAALGEKA